MRAAGRSTRGYVLAAMLAAAVTGRFLDATAALPGVHETPMLRGAAAGWLATVVGAVVVGAAVSSRWSTTASLKAVTRVVVPGQLVVFFAAEAFVRVANGRGAIDADGLAGACLQAALALMLLLALTVAFDTVLRCAPLRVAPPRLRRLENVEVPSWPSLAPAPLLVARGPPRTAGT